MFGAKAAVKPDEKMVNPESDDDGPVDDSDAIETLELQKRLEDLQIRERNLHKRAMIENLRREVLHLRLYRIKTLPQFILVKMRSFQYFMDNVNLNYLM